MPLIRWIARNRQNGQLPHELDPGAFADHRSSDALRRILERERTRAERSGEPVAAIVFTPRNREVARVTQRNLSKLLRRRLRCTDEVGSLMDGRLVAVLPGASSEGAWNVADDVCSGFRGQPLPPHCEVFCYPSDPSSWLFEEDQNAQERTAAPAAPRSARAMELLLMRRMPLWKRAIDIVVSAMALMVLSPVFAVAALAVRLTSPGPVLFGQWRVGLGGRPFRMFKFRSMVIDAEQQQHKLMHHNEQEGPVFKIRNDPRITPVGKFLRSTSIDELPQLWNVFKGDMSLVGPRPPLRKEVCQYETWQRRRLDVTPGITCIWQVNGRSQIPFTQWIRMDIQYIRSVSIFKDFSLLLRTIPAVLLRRGAN